MALDPDDGDIIDANFIPTDAVNLATPIAAIISPDRRAAFWFPTTRRLVRRFDLNGNFLGTFAPAARKPGRHAAAGGHHAAAGRLAAGVRAGRGQCTLGVAQFDSSVLKEPLDRRELGSML